MPVRRTSSASSPVRGAALAGALLVLTPLAACAGETSAAPEAGEVESTAPASPTVAASPSPSRAGKAAKKLEGGGFATAVPGSDAPDRKVDVGPQYAVSDDLDIEEIERLVAAVEALTKEQRVGQPLAGGGSVAAAVGTFGYRWFADGSVAPDPAWVAANIRTEEVPILGSVTCHRVMLPQLRSALREVVARGLADEINPGEYAGCYVPRFIGRDPARGLSLHTWGIALDLNVPGNLRGTTGEMDRDVVAIFKKWGFAWGGDWAWTDPMHFELARLVEER
ncbi:MAG TPA: M15 family metallopeptidase [Nocardioidaceae bacterium]